MDYLLVGNMSLTNTLTIELTRISILVHKFRGHVNIICTQFFLNSRGIINMWRYIEKHRQIQLQHAKLSQKFSFLSLTAPENKHGHHQMRCLNVYI